jgi:hypothetical protein
VIESVAFRNNLLTAQRAAEFHQIKDDIEHGRDLRKYLSRDVEHAVVVIPSARRRPDLDLMLNDWGVHHLHISSEVEANGFVKRGGPLLFVVFRPDRAYFVDVFDHKSFHKERVLEILVQEWPTDRLIDDVKGFIGIGSQLTEDERRTLRRKHVGIFFEHAGKIYLPRGGLLAGGYSINALREADRIVIQLQNFEKATINRSSALEEVFRTAGIPYPTTSRFEFTIVEDMPTIFESSTGKLLKGVL